jgi:hypothetical protein
VWKLVAAFVTVPLVLVAVVALIIRAATARHLLETSSSDAHDHDRRLPRP